MCNASLAVSGGSGYDEYADWDGGVRTVRVRKAHRCEVCRDQIPVGSFASIWVSGSEGSVNSYYCHLACRSLWERISEYGLREVAYCHTLAKVEDYIDPVLADTHRSIVRWSHGGPWVPVEVGDE